MSFLSLHAVSKTYPGNQKKAVNNASFLVEEGDMVALLGESGSGKSTLLRLIAGLEHLDAGEIILENETLDNGKLFTKPEHRGIGLVFQDFALFPHLSIRKNIEIAVKQRTNKFTVTEKLLDLTAIGEFAERLPQQISGGQQQRAALARALANDPKLLLLDEPFSSLDTGLKQKMRLELKQLIHKTGKTSILVTHDTRDALELANKIAVIKDGEILQYDTAEAIYNNPKHFYTASLFGSVNIIAQAKEHQVQVIRPEFVRVAPNMNGSAVVSDCLFAGLHYELSFTVMNNPWKAYSKVPVEPGTCIEVDIDNTKTITLHV